MKKNNNPGQMDLLIHLFVQFLENYQQFQNSCSCQKTPSVRTHDEYTDSADTMKIMKISYSTLSRYRKEGLIKFIKRKGKIYYLISSFFKKED